MKLALSFLVCLAGLAQTGSSGDRGATSNATWTQNATGAVATTVAKKLQDTVSLKDFGCYGDASHDDTTCVQAALSAIVDSGTGRGRRLSAPAGTYRITSTITLSVAATDLTLDGEGSQTRFLWDGSTTGPLFSFSSLTNSVLRRFYWSANTGKTLTTGISITSGSGNTIDVNGESLQLPPTTFSGPVTVSNAIVIPDALPATATAYAGSNIGAKVNAAYAALPSTGGTILIPPKSDGSCWDYDTPIVLNTVGKYVSLQGAGARATCLNFTPTTSTCVTSGLAQGGSSPCIAIELDFTASTGGGYLPAVVDNIDLRNASCITNGGCGSTAIGIDMGQANGGCAACDFRNVRISGFGKGAQARDANHVGWGIVFTNPSIVWNTIGLSGFNLENVHLNGGRIAVNGTGISAAGGQIFANSVSFDSNTVVAYTNTAAIGAQTFECVMCHFENLGVPNTHFITGSATIKLIGGDVLNDTSSASPADYFFDAGGNGFTADRVTLTSVSQSLTQVVKVQAGYTVTGALSFINKTPTNLATIVGGASTWNPFHMLPIPANNLVAQDPWDIKANLAILGGSAGKAACFKSDGKTLGYCSSTPTSGVCTCN